MLSNITENLIEQAIQVILTGINDGLDYFKDLQLENYLESYNLEELDKLL